MKTVALLTVIALKFWGYKLAPVDAHPWVYYTVSGWAGVAFCALLMREHLGTWIWVWASAIGMFEEALQGICGLRALIGPFAAVPGESICKTQLGFSMSLVSLTAVAALAAVVAHAAVKRERTEWPT